MKQPSLYVALYASTLLSLVAAKALLAVFDSSVVLGQTYPVEWLSDEADILELLLVQQTSSGSKSVESLFEDVVSDVPGGSYNWTVNSTLETGSGYGLWLSSEPVSNATDSFGYADLTDWFCVLADENSTCSSVSSSSPTTSSSSTATTNASATAISSQTSDSTSGSGTLASQTAGSANNDLSSSENNDSGLSTGAIAGIVLGALAGFAVILLIVLWMLRRKHKERKAKATATAELNATTDDDRRPELGTDEKANRHELGAGSDTKPPVEKDGDALTSAEDSMSKTGKAKLQQDPVEMP
ncbi:hypothetical protein LTR70_008659 [Exophiala xenobiotica]|uniref:Yeast cell wall synthesis Kre9/Knh1-like N-terminal domain-containing protein n=1 Tax=Lithohypha guttulata TaxID=1690604 RepID=A0ABR0KI81_9EURO|nr:hypothetical protein LTR24_002277 [Lithohypha guttulata]KAK5311623.1 hypothetical protein LTR70_008659 [Exophiala xenobiotica]